MFRGRLFQLPAIRSAISVLTVDTSTFLLSRDRLSTGFYLVSCGFCYSPVVTMPPMYVKWNLVRFDTASLAPTAPTPTPMPGPPYDSSPFVILAAVLGSLAFGIGVLWLARCAYVDPLLRQARRADPDSWYTLRLPPPSPGSIKR